MKVQKVASRIQQDQTVTKTKDDKDDTEENN